MEKKAIKKVFIHPDNKRKMNYIILQHNNFAKLDGYRICLKNSHTRGMKFLLCISFL